MRVATWRTLVLVSFSVLVAACSKPVKPGWSGYVEGEYVYVAAPLAGALVKLSVQRGQAVVRGAPLFTLESEHEHAASEEAAARVDSARAQAANTDKGKRSDEIAVTMAQLTQARAQATLATTELARQQQLVAKGFISAAKLDELRATEQQTRAHVAELEAALRVARLPARKDERTAAEATAQAAQFAFRQSEWREQQKQQVAATDALVADTFFRVGEWVNAGQPVVSLLSADGVKVRFFVSETELGAIATGQAVSIGCDGCGALIAARISFISTQAEYTPPIIYSNTQRAKLVFMIEARPDVKDAPRLKPGQPVDVQRAAAAP